MYKIFKLRLRSIIFYSLVFSFGWSVCFFNLTQTTYNPQSDCNEAITKTYLEKIETASDNFYREYFIISPTVDYYSITVKKICKDKSSSIITFISQPFIGAHNTVGIDEISFSAYLLGNIELKEFKHKKSYSLPEHLKSLVKKPIPGKYE